MEGDLSSRVEGLVIHRVFPKFLSAVETHRNFVVLVFIPLKIAKTFTTRQFSFSAREVLGGSSRGHWVNIYGASFQSKIPLCEINHK